VRAPARRVKIDGQANVLELRDAAVHEDPGAGQTYLLAIQSSKDVGVAVESRTEHSRQLHDCSGTGPVVVGAFGGLGDRVAVPRKQNGAFLRPWRNADDVAAAEPAEGREVAHQAGQAKVLRLYPEPHAFKLPGHVVGSRKALGRAGNPAARIRMRLAPSRENVQGRTLLRAFAQIFHHQPLFSLPSM